MTKQEIIDAFDVAWRLRQLVELVASEEARCEMVSAAETIIGSVTDDDEAIYIILQALKTPAADPQLRELIEENGRLKRELDAANEREAKMMVRIAELTADPVEAKPEKKKRAYHGCAFAARTMLECLQQVIEQTANFVERTADDD